MILPGTNIEASHTPRDQFMFGEVAKGLGEYCYLEIGSYQGGSLLPHLLSPNCKAAYSIDLRCEKSKNKTEAPDIMLNNTTEYMLGVLKSAGADIEKLKCHDGTINDIPEDFIQHKIDLFLVDGEHTDEAAMNDILFCLKLCKDGIILVHDKDHVKVGVEEALKRAAVPYETQEITSLIRAIRVGNKIGK